MNKTELIAQVAEKTGLSKKDSELAVGFGTFSVTTRAAHQGVNPATGAAITIPEKKVVKFKAGAEMAL